MKDTASTLRSGDDHPGPVGARDESERSQQRVEGPGAEKRSQMNKRTGEVPESVDRAADTAWGKFRDRLSFSKAAAAEDNVVRKGRADPESLKSPEQKMIEKIKLRMSQYPEWYETDPDKLAVSVARELERIGELLDRQLANADDPVEVWQIPLSVFNWLVQTPNGESFVRGALRAWSNAEHFNGSYAANLSDDQRKKLRAPFMGEAPMCLNVVLEELLETGLVITFSKKFIGPEFKYLVMRVQSPIAN
jgi:hypothetical protein